jgi:hypothetical protein
VVGQAPVEATVYEMERLPCNACGQVFTAEEPECIGPDKYDATATAMIAQLKYGTGVPFTRLERMEAQMGIREVEQRNGESVMKFAPMKKTIYSLGALREALNAANRRYTRTRLKPKR